MTKPETVPLRHGLAARYITHAELAAQKRAQAPAKAKSEEPER